MTAAATLNDFETTDYFAPVPVRLNYQLNLCTCAFQLLEFTYGSLALVLMRNQTPDYSMRECGMYSEVQVPQYVEQVLLLLPTSYEH